MLGYMIHLKTNLQHYNQKQIFLHVLIHNLLDYLNLLMIKVQK